MNKNLFNLRIVDVLVELLKAQTIFDLFIHILMKKCFRIVLKTPLGN